MKLYDEVRLFSSELESLLDEDGGDRLELLLDCWDDACGDDEWRELREPTEWLPPETGLHLRNASTSNDVRS